jgi:hypothetical protein
MDAWLLSYLSVMYFFNAVDRVSLTPDTSNSSNKTRVT